MDECPRCHCFNLVYYPQREGNVCGACGFTKPEKYEHYIKRKDCGKDLLYPSPVPKQSANSPDNPKSANEGENK